MKHVLLLLAALLATSNSYATQAKPPTRTDSMLKPHQKHYLDVFGRWLKDQRILSDVPLSDIPVDDSFISAFKEHLFRNATILSNYQEFIEFISAGNLSGDNCMVTKRIASPISIAITSLLSDLDHAPENFVDQLRMSALNSPQINIQEEKNSITDTITKHQLALRMLVSHKDPLVENKRLFSVGNRLVDYCFRSSTFHHYVDLYKDKKNYPILRFLNTAVWSTLVGEGWRHWHEDALLALQAAADSGKEIVYIAGGADLYQFLRLGIYNVTVLDPFYPTQDRYYSPGWDYLVSSNAKNKGIGDEIICGAECNNVRLIRSQTQEADYFYAKLSNEKIVKIRKNETRWDIVSEDGNLLGRFIFKRRPVEQEDLASDPKKVFVMSYDEMVYIAQPEIIEGWGTDPSKLDNDFSMIIKQFRNPIDKSFLQNIRIAAMLNIYELRFIKFASDPT